MAKKTIKLTTFIRNNRTKLDAKIIEIDPTAAELNSINDDERRVMVINEPELKEWAIAEGVVFD